MVGGGNRRQLMSHHPKQQQRLKKPIADEVKTAFAKEIKRQAALASISTISISGTLEKIKAAIGNSKLTVKTFRERLECWIKKGWMKVVGNDFVIPHSGLTQILKFAET